MLRKIAVALLAASVIAAPAFARTGTAGSAGKPAAVGATVAAPKAAAPAKVVRHVKKTKRHRRTAHVRHFHGGKAGVSHLSTGPATVGKRGART